MKLKIAVLATGVTLAITGMLSAQAQNYNPKDKKQMRDLAVEVCSKTREAVACGCFADDLVKNLNEKEWKVFIADATKSNEAPAGVSENDLDNYGRKIAAAGNNCGL